MTTLDLPATAVLTAAEEVELARRIEAGVFATHLLATKCPTWASQAELYAIEDDGQAAWQHFYAANLRLATLVAHRWARQSQVDAEEIIQECCLALAPVIRLWDWRRGHRFSTLAWPRLSFAAQQACWRSRAAGSSAATITRGHLRLLPDLDDALAAPVDDDDPADDIWTHMRQLNATQRKVVKARFGFTTGSPVSYERLAEDMHTSTYFVKQLESKALEQLEWSARRAA